jgi:serine/threonine protein phosphatase PrpC
VTQEDLGEAFRAAHTAVAALPWMRTMSGDPPETTIVAALRQGPRILAGWLGDSRAYLAGPERLRPLTQDHSWINEVVSAGKMTEEEAVQAPQAHCITRSLGGPGSGAGDEPSLLTIDLVEPWQYLILCTDGLWNYVPTSEEFRDLVRRRPPGGALALARFLVDYALERGGRDNITAAVLDLAQG